MRDGELFLSSLASYNGAKTRNKRKCICPAENIFRDFLIKFFFTCMTWKLELDGNGFFTRELDGNGLFSFLLTAVCCFYVGIFLSSSPVRNSSNSSFSAVHPSLHNPSVLTDWVCYLGKWSPDYYENKVAYKTGFPWFENSTFSLFRNSLKSWEIGSVFHSIPDTFL